MWADLGVGRVPLSIVWQTFAFAFGATGLCANAVFLSSRGALPLWTLAWSLPLALLCAAWAVTRKVARVVGRVVSNPDQEATSRAALVGATGVVISSKVDTSFGEVRILDRWATWSAWCAPSRRETAVPEQREVVVVEYDKARDRLLVAPLDAEIRAPTAVIFNVFEGFLHPPARRGRRTFMRRGAALTPRPKE